MSITNKLSIFAENATINNEDYTTTTAGLVYSDDAWKNVDIRNSGESTGIASSRRFNTALRQATFGSKLLGDILVTRYADILHSDISCDNISNVISDIQEIMPPGQQFLRPDDVYTSAIQDGAVTTNKIEDSAVITEKIRDSAITTNKIKDGVVTTAKFSTSAKCPYADRAISDNDGRNIFENYFRNISSGSNSLTFAIGRSAYMVQWGMCTDTTTEGTVSLPDAYENSNYSVILTAMSGASDTGVAVKGVQNNSFTYLKSYTGTKFYWLTIGQA